MSTAAEVACPECGTRATVTPGRRESADFCARCDFPLFWTPQAVELTDRDTERDTLRRLPGTAGQVTVASATCPHCSEANPLTAELCTRCGRPMVIVEEPPPVPEPVVIAPEPPPVPEPEPRSLLWLWILLGAATVLVLVLLLWWATRG